MAFQYIGACFSQCSCAWQSHHDVTLQPRAHRHVEHLLEPRNCCVYPVSTQSLNHRVPSSEPFACTESASIP